MLLGDCPCADLDFVAAAQSPAPGAAAKACLRAADPGGFRCLGTGYHASYERDTSTTHGEGTSVRYTQVGGAGLAMFVLAWLGQLANAALLGCVVPRAEGAEGGEYAEIGDGGGGDGSNAQQQAQGYTAPAYAEAADAGADAEVAAATGSGGGGSGGGDGGGREASGGGGGGGGASWTCRGCMFENDASASACTVCGEAAAAASNSNSIGNSVEASLNSLGSFGFGGGTIQKKQHRRRGTQTIEEYVEEQL